METATLDDFMTLNDQLAALIQAGVPIDIDLGRPGTDPAGALEKINAAIARRVSRGASLLEALECEEQAVTPSYRSLAQLALRSGNLCTALSGSNRISQSVEDAWHAVRLSILYPTVVGCLAYAGLVASCLFFVPTLENMYHSMQIRPGWGLHALQSVRGTLPYWIAVPPIALLLGSGWARIKSRRMFSRARADRVLAWLPGMSRAIYEQRCANFAETLSALLEAGVPLEEGLGLASGACPDAALGEGARALAAILKPGQVLSEDSPWAKRFPPFLRWALWQSEAITGRASALSMAAGIYRESAQRRVVRLQALAPIVMCVILGGGVTLLYGLALFVPVVEMLQGLAS